MLSPGLQVNNTNMLCLYTIIEAMEFFGRNIEVKFLNGGKCNTPI